MNKPTQAQLRRRRRPFRFTYNGQKSWFYLDDNEHLCSFHQETSYGQDTVWGLPIERLIKALKDCGYI